MSLLINTTYGRIVYGIAKFRTFFWSFFLKKIGRNVDTLSRVIIMSPQKVEIGHGCSNKHRR